MRNQAALARLKRWAGDRRVRYAVVFLAIGIGLFWIFGPSVDKSANGFVRATVERRWSNAFSYMSDDEKRSLNWDAAKFSKFCDTLADHCWPNDVTVQVEEVIRTPPQLRPGEIGIDSTPPRAGQRRYVVTLRRRKDNVAVQLLHVTYRHGLDGEWHPDVLDALIQLNRGNKTRGGNPPWNLYLAMKATGTDHLSVYPNGIETSLQQILSYFRGTEKFYTYGNPYDPN